MKTALLRTALVGAIIALALLGSSISNCNTFGEPPAYQPDDPPTYSVTSEEPPMYTEGEPSTFVSDSVVRDFLDSAFLEVPSMVGPMKVDCGCSSGKPCTCKPEECVCPACAVGCGKGRAARRAARQGGGGDDSGGAQVEMSFVDTSSMGMMGYPQSQYASMLQSFQQALNYPIQVQAAAAYGAPVVNQPGYTYTDTNDNTWTYSCTANGYGWVQVASAPQATASVMLKAGDKCPCCGMTMTKEEAEKATKTAPKTAPAPIKTAPIQVSPPTYQPATYQTSMFYPRTGYGVGSYSAGGFSACGPNGCGTSMMVGSGGSCAGGNCGSSGRGFGIFRRR